MARRKPGTSEKAPAAAFSGGGSSRTSPSKLSPTQREIVQVCADAVQQLGLSRSVGQIFGVIYCSPRPLTFADVVAALQLSKGSVSQGLRFLRELGAIKPVDVAGEWREHFVAETKLRRLLRGVVETRLRGPLQLGEARLKTIERQLAGNDEPDREFLAQRLDSLQTWHRKTLFFLPLLQKFLGSSG